MLPSRRNKLTGVSAGQAEHMGLWFDKFLTQQLKKNESVATGEQTPQMRLLEECAGIREPDSYALFYQRWKTALVSCGAQMKEAAVQGRLAVGLGDESVIETAITLHHTYGMPYIPGSALKGLAASFARQHLADAAWQQNGDAYKILFGTTEEAGFLTFFDALYVPGSGFAGRAVYPDVITVHHPDYYQQGRTPADWDNPTPIPFMSANGRYLIALTGPLKWVNAGFRILQLALVDVGVGAKTSSGYGRLSLGETESGLRPSPTTGAQSGSVDPKEQVVEQFKQQLAALPTSKVAGEIAAFVQRWRTLEVDESYKQKVARAILAKVREAGREKQSKDKSWYQELLASLPDEDS